MYGSVMVQGHTHPLFPSPLQWIGSICDVPPQLRTQLCVVLLFPPITVGQAFQSVARPGRCQQRSLVVTPIGRRFLFDRVAIPSAKLVGSQMHWLLLVSSILMVLADGVAAAQSGTGTTSSLTEKAQAPGVRPAPADMSPAQVRDLTAGYIAQCLQDWDAATHMTKQEWGRTCRRVVQNRVKFRLEQPR